MSMYSLYRPRKSTVVATIPGTHYPRMGPCGASLSDGDGNVTPCATETMKANPGERCGECKARLKNASRLRANAADRRARKAAK